MKNINKALCLFFLLGGVALIVAIFLLFLKEVLEPDMLYLNMVSCCVAYAITFVSAADIIGSVKRVSKAAPGYGLRWTAEWIYLPAVIVTVVLSIILKLGFNLCLILQISYLFVFLMLTVLSVALSHNVNSFEAKEEVRKSGLKDIQTRIAMVEAQCAINAGALSPKVAQIKEEIRYVTASDSPAAAALEEKLIGQLALLEVKLSEPVIAQESVAQELETCLKLIELRKKQY